MSAPPKKAILLLAHGTPGSAEDVAEYLRRVTGGRPVPEAVVEEVKHRYALIGRSPLTELTLAQGEALAKRLNAPVYVGMRNWHPYIKDTVATMLADGVTQAVVLCLAPQNSRTSTGLYRKAVEEAVAGKMKLESIEAWHDAPRLIEAFAVKLRAALKPGVPVLFTAHSVPTRTLQTDASGAGDPYESQARETAALVAAKCGLREKDWHFAFQSQGMSGGPWTGPTVEETLTALAAAGHRAVVIQAIGFVCDHVEVLYDIDIAFKKFANERGMELTRAESLNVSPEFVEALVEIVGGPKS